MPSTLPRRPAPRSPRSARSTRSFGALTALALSAVACSATELLVPGPDAGLASGDAGGAPTADGAAPDAAADGAPLDGSAEGGPGDAGDSGLDAGDAGTADGAPDAATTAPRPDGTNAATVAPAPGGMLLSTPATAPSPPGAFNGAGVGNKAFLGFPGHAGQAVRTFPDLVVTASSTGGSNAFYVNLQVDCDGDGRFDPAVDGVVVADAETLPALAVGPAPSVVTLRASDPVWRIVGGGVPPAAPKCGLYSHLGGPGRPLGDVPPSALVWNGSTGDGGMPRGRAMPGVLLVLGDSSNLVERAVLVQRVVIGASVYAF